MTITKKTEKLKLKIQTDNITETEKNIHNLNHTAPHGMQQNTCSLVSFVK